MTLYDISVPLSASLASYEGDPPVQIDPWTRMTSGAPADVSRLSLSSHSGTHVDAPAHFLPEGRGVDQIDLHACIGPAEVIDLTPLAGALIDAAALASRTPAGTERLLLKTRNSRLWQSQQMNKNFIALAPDAAAWLAAAGARLAGIDYLSIAPFDDPAPVHRILLAAGIVILEGLDLSEVPAGRYQLICLPLRLPSLDGAPARAVLIAGD